MNRTRDFVSRCGAVVVVGLLVAWGLALTGCVAVDCPTSAAPGFIPGDAPGHQVEPAGVTSYLGC